MKISKRTKKIFWISLAIILLGILAVVYWGYLGIMEGLRGSQPSGDPSYRAVEDVWEAEKNTKDWITVRNEEFGFEIQIPPGCELGETIYYNSGDIYIYTNPSCYCKDCREQGEGSGIYDGGIRLSIFPTTSNAPDFCENKVEVISNNPMSEAKLCYQNLERGWTTHHYSFIYQDREYMFGIGYQDKNYNIKIEKAILNSFRFTR
ncbi:MAG: hypothetical protein EOM19_01440 [Candidatus Moranbacteria bacterium]|nr:hypothetical protein [Candidatus Moranbacteria bacterium]